MKIKIGFSEQDLRDLIRGEEFNWTFPTEDGKEEVEVLLFNEEYGI